MVVQQELSVETGSSVSTLDLDLESDAFYNFLLVHQQYCDLMSIHCINFLYTKIEPGQI